MRTASVALLAANVANALFVAYVFAQMAFFSGSTHGVVLFEPSTAIIVAEFLAICSIVVLDVAWLIHALRRPTCGR